ncbi:STAS domain-containing protein [Dactylosporangium sp. NPDC051485]|uniref:STAS domain-containing protein n=1 Tax=Dactylosporangium sp. NPDC051485 TaxID=3154846 RepID=UPI00343192A5
MDLCIMAERRGGEMVVQVRGVIDIASAPYLRHEILKLSERTPPQFVINVAEVRLIDAAALRVLLHLQRRFEHHGGGLRLVAPTTTTQTALRLTGLAGRLTADLADRPVHRRSRRTDPPGAS